jgi:hypothetical protein
LLAARPRPATLVAARPRPAHTPLVAAPRPMPLACAPSPVTCVALPFPYVPCSPREGAQKLGWQKVGWDWGKHRPFHPLCTETGGPANGEGMERSANRAGGPHANRGVQANPGVTPPSHPPVWVGFGRRGNARTGWDSEGARPSPSVRANRGGGHGLGIPPLFLCTPLVRALG